MTDRQRELARHALGFPNKKNTSYRNHFCTGADSEHYADWESMVAEGYAVKQIGPYWGGDDMFHMTLKGALLARDAKEHLRPARPRRNDAVAMNAAHVELVGEKI